MMDVFAAAQSVSTHHPPLLGQAVLCDFISEGHFARHIRRMREVYAERLGVLLEAAREKLEGVAGDLERRSRIADDWLVAIGI